VGLGRSVYVALGHQAEAFDNPEFRQILQNSLVWLVGSNTGSTGCTSN
jgi:type 1 glutamine amidotransferase